jgi:predicted ATPase/class 3 adenylate cyclase
VTDARKTENRRTVTILFTDIVDSSRLSLALDPEAVQDLLVRYFEEMSAIIRRHGGIVERYIGDEIMAMFGVPVLHEDDALRAVRTAAEMNDTLAILNRELDAGWGVKLRHRIGINTGEVITGDHSGPRFTTGEAVRLAKRLEEAAAPGEILIGEATYRLVRDAVTVKPTGPRTLKHGEKIHALAVTNVLAHAPGFARRFDTPFVDRERERAVLNSLFGDVVSAKACHLLTVLGDAGVGKSRLMLEFTSGRAPDVTVLRGRCLPYGEGITYWPLAEIVREIARADGLDPDKQSAATISATLAGDEKAALITERVAEALGFGGKGGTSEETFWAFRKLFEALTRQGPVVIVLEDFHWAHSTFLDLIEHVADFSRGFPILIVCIARPELRDTRPGWGHGKPNATSIVLGALSGVEAREMISNLLDNAPAPPAVESRIAGAAEGNPLFAEELVAKLVDEEMLVRAGDGWVARSDLSELPVPSTINALLAARLEGLPAYEFDILTTAAVEGAVFHKSAVSALGGPAIDPVLADGLLALVRRDLIRPDTPDFAGEEAYRFRHTLIRDAAYRSLSKKARADKHERFAAWLELRAAKRLGEFEEIVGYHLEQAFQHRVAIGSLDSRATSLAARASARLESAGRLALTRSDLSAAIALLERVSRLLPTGDPRRIELLVELGAALIERGRLAEAAPAIDEAERLAAAANDQRLMSHVLIQRQFLRSLHGEEGGLEEAARAATMAVPVFERFGDDLGLCRARRLEAWFFFNDCRAEAAAAAWERAAIHARRAEDRHEFYESLRWIASMLWFGPTPAVEGIRRCEAMRAEVRESSESEAVILRQLACLNAVLGRFAVARQLIATSNATYADLGRTLFLAGSEHETVVELLAGDPAAAERSARAAYRALEEMGERAFRSTMAATLALVILEQGRDEEADALAEVSASLGATGDLMTQIRWRRVRARVLARRGETQAAEAHARQALAIAEATDFINERADALIDLSHVLEESSRREEAAAALSGAVHLYELKGNIVAAARTKSRLSTIVGV